MKTKPTALVILDGFGWNESKDNNPIAQAKKPTIDYLWHNYPHAILQASGEYVGLPKNYIGNSQVGHFTIGAGKVVPQPLTIINNAINDGTFFENEILNNCLKKISFDFAQDERPNSLHIIGLLSDAGVHSHENHLYAFIKAALKYNIKNIYLHLILDGRDVDEKSADVYLEKLEKFINNHTNIKIGSIHGRFYAMDRDQNWQRTQQSFDVLKNKQNIKFAGWPALRSFSEVGPQALKYYYEQNRTDEFIPPTQLDQNAIIKDNDGVIIFNFRPERIQQLIKKILENIKVSFLLTPFEVNQTTCFMFKIPQIKDNLMCLLSQRGYSTFAIAETEKYAHITYFFNCFRSEKYKNETQVIVDSIKLNDYSKKPEMSANVITNKIVESLENDPKDFYLINYANADMVGHSGDFDATVKAIECLDKQLHILYEEFVNKRNGILYITADHGNAEIKFKDKKSKAHTVNPVPFFFVRKDLKNKNIQLDLHQLADIKNFIMHIFIRNLL